MGAQTRLLAMAGERMWIGDHREVSGVCTHPESHGSGFARSLLGNVVNRMLGEGQTPFLHVDSRNERAIGLYQSLGFARRTEFPLVQLRRVCWRQRIRGVRSFSQRRVTSSHTADAHAANRIDALTLFASAPAIACVAGSVLAPWNIGLMRFSLSAMR
jgi:hypothetical protein